MPLPPGAACERPPPWRGAQELCHRGKLILPDSVLQRCKASADSFTLSVPFTEKRAPAGGWGAACVSKGSIAKTRASIY